MERAGGAQLVVGCVMPFAKGGGGILIPLKDLRDARCFPRPRAVIARKAGGHLRDHTAVNGVVVASGEQRRSRRRAERCGVKAVVAQALVSQPLQCWRIGWPAERARLTEADIVQHDQQHVGCVIWRCPQRNNVRLGVGVGFSNASTKLGIGQRQDVRKERRGFC
jgi:hypothetical protein